MTWPISRTLLAVLAVLVAFSTSGCSVLIARSGVPSSGALYYYKTRAEVWDQFGKPDDTSTCPDGRAVESRWIRQQIQVFDPPSGPAEELGQAMLQGAYQGSYGLVDILVWPVTMYRSEKAKLHYAFVYDEADRVLYVYDLTASPPMQFSEATGALVWLLSLRLEDGKCDSWTACLTDYVQEARRRATCLGYTLGADEEQAFERMFAIGEEVDSGSISREDGLAEIKEVLDLRLSR